MLRPAPSSRHALSETELVRRALALRDSGRPEEGVALLEGQLATHRASALVWQTLGLLHRALQDSGPAMRALERAAALAPSDARIAHALARVTLEAGLPAADLFLRAAVLAPGDASVRLGLAAARLAVGDGATAIAELDALLAANPGWIEGQEALLDLRWLMGDREGATAGFERALARDPANQPLWMAMVNRLMHAGDYARAARAVAAAETAAGAWPALELARAVCADETGAHAAAGAILQRFADHPDPGVATRHMRHLLRTGQTEAALKRGEPFLGKPGDAELWPYMATCWRLLQDRRAAWLEEDPRLVAELQLLDAAEVAALAACLRRLHAGQGEPLGQSVRGGTQTDGPLFARVEPEIRSLREKIRSAVAGHLAGLGPPDADHPVLRYRPGPVRFSGSWSVRLAGAGHHSHHVHPQGRFSSAFYVVVPTPADAGPPPAGWLGFGAPPAELGIDLPPFRTVEPRPGRLALFPSIMWHGTLPFAQGERMTVAFDVARPV
jgi:tetratricopeptide (TPR) repeat protein